jgi:hypothetical protein
MGQRGKHEGNKHKKNLVDVAVRQHSQKSKHLSNDKSEGIPAEDLPPSRNSIVERLSKLTKWQVALIITILAFAVLWTGINNPFEGDDFPQIVNNPVVHSISNVKLFFEGSTFYNGGSTSAPLTGGNYRPLMTVVFSTLYSLFGAHTFIYHLVQILLCIGGTFLLYLVLGYFLGPMLSLVLSLIFLVHPLNSQVAFAIPAMQDALYFFFGILAMWLLMRFHSVRSLWLVALSLFFALLSKETGLMFVGMPLLYLIWFDRKRFLPFAGIVAIPTIIWLILKAHAVGLTAQSGGIAPISNLALGGRLLTAPSAVSFYLVKLIFPWKLASGYYWVYRSFSFQHVILPLVIDLAVIGLVVYVGKLLKARLPKTLYHTYLFFAIWTATGIVTILQIVPLEMTASETWFRFSFVGILGMVGLVLIAFQKQINPRWFFIIASILVCILGFRTAIRGTDWSSQYKLSMSDISASKEDYVQYNSLAGSLAEQGEFAAAEPYAKRSLAIFPSSNGYYALGAILMRQGDYNGAEAAFTSSLRYNSTSVTALDYTTISELLMIYSPPGYNVQSFYSTAFAAYPDDSTLWSGLAIYDEIHHDSNDAKANITKATSYGQVSQPVYDGIMQNRPFTVYLTDVAKTVNVP